MEFKTALFYVFSAILILAATSVITARNPVHAALFLVLSFFSAAAIWMLLKAEFLAIILVLVYVGAVGDAKFCLSSGGFRLVGHVTTNEDDRIEPHPYREL